MWREGWLGLVWSIIFGFTFRGNLIFKLTFFPHCNFFSNVRACFGFDEKRKKKRGSLEDVFVHSHIVWECVRVCGYTYIFNKDNKQGGEFGSRSETERSKSRKPSTVVCYRKAREHPTLTCSQGSMSDTTEWTQTLWVCRMLHCIAFTSHLFPIFWTAVLKHCTTVQH